LLIVINFSAYAQISPGKLYKGHANFEGISNCTKCHVLGKNVEEIKCLNCHKKIKNLINLKRGFHSSKEAASKKCWQCHGEHFGRNFEIIRFDEKKFNHIKSGYKLVGSHKKLDCKKCHNSNFIKERKLSKKTKTFLGLNQDCLTCHKDEHRGTLSNDCAKCHLFNKFSPAEKFDHAKSKYPLTGKHKNVKCIKCHKFEKSNKGKFQKFTGLKFNNCFYCHNDIHKGKLGKNCKSCHNTKSFAKINYLKNFNHNKTNFPLVGKHRNVDCNSCHKKNLLSKPKYKSCSNCHKDYHKGEFRNKNIKSDCNECHDEYSFTQSHFTIEQHSKTKFPLTGAHKAIACTVCHKKNNFWKFNITGEKCIECHKNVHDNSINKKYFNKNKCEKCHSTLSWNKITFNHNITNFKLVGKHKTVSCSECHFAQKHAEKNLKHFIVLSTECTFCHNDVHRGQFDNGEKEYCKKCHNNYNWKQTLFDHNKTNFKLEGAHKNLDCLNCHKIIKDKNGTYILYKIKGTKCISCHS